MTEFRKYQHIERFGTSEVRGIEFGTCYVFPKLDGTNASVWLDENGEIQAGSRNRQLSLEEDNAGFYAWAKDQEDLGLYLKEFPRRVLYGEWLVPHTLKTYREDAWRKFYIFDVFDAGLGKYLPYGEYRKDLRYNGLDYIAPLFKIKNPSPEKLAYSLKENTYLIKDGEGTGEGLVVKNYDFVNKYGRTTWAKIVENKFKDAHRKASELRESKNKKEVEAEIVETFVTQPLVDKVYSKLDNDEKEGFNSKMIPRLLHTVFYDLVREESWAFVKKFRNPVVDFRRLQGLCYARVKELKPEVFS